MNIFKKKNFALLLLIALPYGLSAMEKKPGAPLLRLEGERAPLLGVSRLTAQEARLQQQDAQLTYAYTVAKAQKALLDATEKRQKDQLIAKLSEGERNLRVLEALMRSATPRDLPNLQAQHELLTRSVGELRRMAITWRISLSQEPRASSNNSECFSCFSWLFN